MPGIIESDHPGSDDDVPRFIEIVRIAWGDPTAGVGEDDPIDEGDWICQCGETLLDATWTGAAIVRCSECSARWRIVVSSEGDGSQVQIDGPSAIWMAAHPFFHDLQRDFPAEAVLTGELPPVPRTLEPGTAVPVATWIGGDNAAVFYVQRTRRGPGNESADYEDDVVHLRLVDGEWDAQGSGGGGGDLNPLDPPTDLLESQVVVTTGRSSFAGEWGKVTVLGGRCSARVAAIESTDSTGTDRRAIEPSRPFFVVGILADGVVRALGEDGTVLRRADSSAVEWTVRADDW